MRGIIDFIAELWVEGVELFLDFVVYVALPLLVAFLLFMILFHIIGLWVWVWV